MYCGDTNSKAELTYDDIYKLCIVQRKLVRDSQNPKNMDNPIDVIGYVSLEGRGKKWQKLTWIINST